MKFSPIIKQQKHNTPESCGKGWGGGGEEGGEGRKSAFKNVCGSIGAKWDDLRIYLLNFCCMRYFCSSFNRSIFLEEFPVAVKGYKEKIW